VVQGSQIQEDLASKMLSEIDEMKNIGKEDKLKLLGYLESIRPAQHLEEFEKLATPPTPKIEDINVDETNFDLLIKKIVSFGNTTTLKSDLNMQWKALEESEAFKAYLAAKLPEPESPEVSKLSEMTKKLASLESTVGFLQLLFASTGKLVEELWNHKEEGISSFRDQLAQAIEQLKTSEVTLPQADNVTLDIIKKLEILPWTSRSVQSEVNEKIKNLEIEKSKLSDQFTSLQDELKEADLSSKVASQKIEQLEADLKSAEQSLKTEQQKFFTERDSLQEKLSAAEAEIGILSSKAKESTLETKAIQQKLTDLKEQLTDSEIAVHKKTEELSKMKSEHEKVLEQLSFEIGRLEKKTEELEKMYSEEQMMRKQKEEEAAREKAEKDEAIERESKLLSNLDLNNQNIERLKTEIEQERNRANTLESKYSPFDIKGLESSGKLFDSQFSPAVSSKKDKLSGDEEESTSRQIKDLEKEIEHFKKETEKFKQGQDAQIQVVEEKDKTLKILRDQISNWQEKIIILEETNKKLNEAYQEEKSRHEAYRLKYKKLKEQYNHKSSGTTTPGNLLHSESEKSFRQSVDVPIKEEGVESDNTVSEQAEKDLSAIGQAVSGGVTNDSDHNAPPEQASPLDVEAVILTPLVDLLTQVQKKGTFTQVVGYDEVRYYRTNPQESELIDEAMMKLSQYWANRIKDSQDDSQPQQTQATIGSIWNEQITQIELLETQKQSLSESVEILLNATRKLISTVIGSEKLAEFEDYSLSAISDEVSKLVSKEIIHQFQNQSAQIKKQEEEIKSLKISTESAANRVKASEQALADMKASQISESESAARSAKQVVALQTELTDLKARLATADSELKQSKDHVVSLNSLVSKLKAEEASSAGSKQPTQVETGLRSEIKLLQESLEGNELKLANQQKELLAQGTEIDQLREKIRMQADLHEKELTALNEHAKLLKDNLMMFRHERDLLCRKIKDVQENLVAANPYSFVDQNPVTRLNMVTQILELEDCSVEYWKISLMTAIAHIIKDLLRRILAIVPSLYSVSPKRNTPWIDSLLNMIEHVGQGVDCQLEETRSTKNGETLEDCLKRLQHVVCSKPTS
jgi:hypothetical protein